MQKRNYRQAIVNDGVTTRKPRLTAEPKEELQRGSRSQTVKANNDSNQTNMRTADLGNLLPRETAGRPADVDMRAGGGARNRATKSKERNTRLTEMIDERFAFDAVGMKRDVHRIPMVETQSVVGFRLAQCGHRQSPAKRLGKISLDARRFL